MWKQCFGILMFIYMIGTLAEACLPKQQYDTECAEPFLIWERSGVLYPKLCQTPEANGTYIFNCILTQKNDPDCRNKNSTVEEKFTAIFAGDNFDLNITCEIYANSTCRNVLGCFSHAINFDNTNNTLVGFYNFFCGPDYLQKGYSCLQPTNCPYSSERAQKSIVFLLESETISLKDIRPKVTASCGYLTDSDKTCITTRRNLNNCGLAPLIKTYPSDSELACNATDKSYSCAVNTCSATVANFFLNMTGLFECPLSVACAQLFEDHIFWLQTPAGRTVGFSCGSSYANGSVTRTCLADGTWGEVKYACQLPDNALDDILDQLNDVLNNTTTDVPGDATTPTLSKALDSSSNVLSDVSQILTEGDITLSENSLTTLVQIQDNTLTLLEEAIANNVTLNDTEGILNTFIQSINNVLDPTNTEVWNNINNDQTSTVRPSWVIDMTSRYVDILLNLKCENRNDSQYEKTEDFVYVAVGKQDGEVVFPSDQAQQSNAVLNDGFISIPAETLRNKGIDMSVCVGGSYTSTLGQYLETTREDDGKIADFGGEQIVNSDIVSLKFNARTGVSYANLTPPAIITLQPKQKGYKDPVCVYWDFNVQVNNSEQRGTWSTRGCELVSFENDTVTCACDHLTNFAVLMSPVSLAEAKALNIISAIGCGISIFCLLLTIILHVTFWRLIRSDRATILMNLCIALLLALITFMAGINRVESWIACTVIAAIIQFLFLAVFFLMFLMGIEILICVVHVFGTKFRIKVLLPLSWCAAALVVGISLGVTKAEGYGTDKFCWLDTESGLIWAFIGPAGFVIGVNFIVMAVVFKKMSSSHVLKSKSAKIKALTAARSLCVLMPLMGVTWVFGLLAVNDETTFFAYIFCIVNSLQGLFIFLFHCVFNRQIRDAWKQRQARKRSLQTFSSDFRNKSKSAIHSNSFESPEKKHRNSLSNSDEQSSSPPPSGKKNGLINDKDWEKYERRQYHKNIRKGDIYD